jgi:hypothetical protein
MNDLIEQLEDVEREKSRASWECASCGVEANLVRKVIDALRSQSAECKEWESKWADEFAKRGHETAAIEREKAVLLAENKRLRWFADLCRERIGEQHDIPWWLAKEWLEDVPASNRQASPTERAVYTTSEQALLDRIERGEARERTQDDAVLEAIRTGQEQFVGHWMPTGHDIYLSVRQRRARA